MNNEGSKPPENGSSSPKLASFGSGTFGMLARWVLFLCLAVSVGVAAESARLMYSANADKKITEEATVRVMGLTEVAAKTLAPEFTDRDGRLLADPPASPDQLLDPQTLVLAHLDSTDPETPSVNWDEFCAHLQDVTGRKVVNRTFDNGPDDLKAIKDGQIHIVALHAADAPFLVNNLGYQPAAVLGDESGANGNHLDIIVPASTTIATPADLKGHDLVCAVPSSITGYRAAVTLLMKNESLRPNIDYFVTWSMGQKRSIEGVARKEYDAAAISDDKLQTLLASGDVKPTDYKIIYQSSVIPRTTIGWFYNLKPELAAKVKEAILSFQPKTPAADADPAAKLLHFVPTDYKKDFEMVRDMDNRFDPRLDSKTKVKAAAVTQPAAE